MSLVSAAVLFWRCGDNDGGYKAPEFRNANHISFEVLGDELMFSASDIAVLQDRILLSGYSGPGKETFFVYDKNGRLLKSGICQGRGPGETMHGYINMAVHGETVSFTDFSQWERLSFDIGNFLSDDLLVAEKEILDRPEWGTYVEETPAGDMVRITSRSFTKDLDKPQRTVELHKRDGRMSVYEGQVYEDRKLGFYGSTNPEICYSPDGTRMAVTSSPGMIVEIFSLGDEIECTSTCRFIEPKVSFSGHSLEHADNDVFGAGDSFADNEILYIGYDGETTWKMTRGDSGAVMKMYRNIASFDWKGRPLSLYRSDYRIHRFCLDGPVVYAVIWDGEGRSFLARAEL